MRCSPQISELLVRIAACAAFLASSLLGRTLHDLHHKTLGAAESRCDCRHQHSATPVESRGESLATNAGHETPASQHGPGQKDSDEHDSHNCAICQALCAFATAPARLTFSNGLSLPAWRLAVGNERPAFGVAYTDEARGPPSAV